MGRYIERLKNLPPLPAETVDHIRNAIKTGDRDIYGVKHLNVILTKDGHGFFVVESPTVDALLASQEERGISVDRKDIHEIIQMMADFGATSKFTTASK